MTTQALPQHCIAAFQYVWTEKSAVHGFPKLELLMPRVSWTFVEKEERSRLVLYMDRVSGEDLANIVFKGKWSSQAHTLSTQKKGSSSEQEFKVNDDWFIKSFQFNNDRHYCKFEYFITLYLFYRNGESSVLGSDLGGLLKSGELSDVLLHIKSDEQAVDSEPFETLKAHKAVLCARSPVFEKILSTDMVEARTGTVLVDFPVNAMQVLLNYMYTGVAAGLDEDDGYTAMDVLAAADYYGVEALKLLVRDYLKGHINSDNAIDVLVLADRLNLLPLRKAAIRAIASNMKGVRYSPRWTSFLRDRTDLVDEVFQVVAERQHGVARSSALGALAAHTMQSSPRSVTSNKKDGRLKAAKVYTPSLKAGPRRVATLSFAHVPRGDVRLPCVQLQCPDISWTLVEELDAESSRLLLHDVRSSRLVRFGVRTSNATPDEVDVKSDGVMVHHPAGVSGERPAPVQVQLSLYYLHRQSSALGSDMGNLLDTGNGSDLTFVVAASNMETIRVHRAVLCARSAFFRTMFAEVKDATDFGDIVLRHPQKAVLTALRYMYTGLVSGMDGTDGTGPDDAKLITSVCQVASEFQLQELWEVGEENLLRMISAANATQIVIFADKYGSSALKKKGLDCIANNLGEVRVLPDWMLFLSSGTGLLDEFMSVIQQTLLNRKESRSRVK